MNCNDPLKTKSQQAKAQPSKSQSPAKTHDDLIPCQQPVVPCPAPLLPCSYAGSLRVQPPPGILKPSEMNGKKALAELRKGDASIPPMKRLFKSKANQSTFYVPGEHIQPRVDQALKPNVKVHEPPMTQEDQLVLGNALESSVEEDPHDPPPSDCPPQFIPVWKTFGRIPESQMLAYTRAKNDVLCAKLNAMKKRHHKVMMKK